MISPDTFKKEWILSYKKKIKGSDPSIIEKMIWAYSLVENLAGIGFNFIFKGGTSLALVFDRLQRFSVDIDILTSVSREDLERNLNAVVNGSSFLRWELDEKRSYKGNIPKAHYNFFYNSEINNKENNVVLDVLFDDYNYSDSIYSEIRSNLLITSEPVTSVLTPSVNFFMGDKLTAFAPNTIGIPFKLAKEKEIIKQIFDLNFIFDKFTDLKSVLENYKLVFSKQIKYRNLDIELNVALKDTIETAIMIAFGRCNVFRNAEDKDKYNEIITGIKQFKQFSAGVPFGLDEVVSASSKIAYLASVLLSGLKKPFKKFEDTESITDYLIEDPDYNKLNKIKAIPGAALYYLNKTLI